MFFFSIFAANIIFITMDENIILANLKLLLPPYYEVIVSHPTQFISVDIVSDKFIKLPSDVMSFLVSLHIKDMYFLYHHVGNVHLVSFKVLG